MFQLDNQPRRSTLQYDKIEFSKSGAPVGKTIASIEECAFDACSTINKILLQSNSNLFVYGDYPYVMDDTFRGVSKVNYAEGDIFNVTTGEKLAKERCLNKYHKQLNKRLCAFLLEVRTIEACAIHYLKKHKIDFNSVPSVEEIEKSNFQ